MITALSPRGEERPKGLRTQFTQDQLIKDTGNKHILP